MHAEKGGGQSPMRMMMHVLLSAWVLWASDMKNGEMTWKRAATFEPIPIEKSPEIATPMFLCFVLAEQMKQSSWTQTKFECLVDGETPQKKEAQ